MRNSKTRKRKKSKNSVYVILGIVGLIVCGGIGWFAGYYASGNQSEVVETASSVESKEEAEAKEATTEENKSSEEVKSEEVKPEEIEVTEAVAPQETIVYEAVAEASVEVEAPVHEHIWADITEEVYHEEVGRWEDVLVSAEVVRMVPINARKELSICNGCGADITNDPMAHINSRKLAGYLECNGYHTDWRETQVDTKKEVTPAVYNKKWIVDTEAWTETKVVGQECTTCGEVTN